MNSRPIRSAGTSRIPTCLDLIFLVAPICHEHAVDRQVYLPAGASWTDARTGVVYEGGQWITANAPMDTLPVFLRDGRQDYLIGEI